jgi:hypothetical protein
MENLLDLSEVIVQKIFVIVNNGVAEARQDTVPEGFEVEVIDLDVIRMGDSFPSKEAFKYCSEHDIVPERRKNRKPNVEVA